jgi:serine protease Do
LTQAARLTLRRRLKPSQGSGFFIHPDGYAVTTNHLIEQGKTIEISTDDDKNYNATLVGNDPKTDLTLIKVEGGSGFPFIRLADSRLG